MLDPLCIVVAASIATLLCSYWHLLPLPAPDFADSASAATWFAAVFAPFVLRDPHFGVRVGRAQLRTLMRAHARRWALMVAAIVVLGVISDTLDRFPIAWLFLWLAASLVATSFTRLLVVAWLRRRQRQGHLTEVVAVVGSGTLADRLVDALQRGAPRSTELLGIFDDRTTRIGQIGRTGDLAQLIELGKKRRIDCIVLTLPPTAEQRLNETLQRLKALAAPIGLCPQHLELPPAHEVVGISGRRGASGRAIDAIEDGSAFAPRWVTTLLDLSGAAALAVARRLASLLRVVPAARPAMPIYTFDALDLEGFAPVAAGWGLRRYGYVVTPNADHLIRLHDDASFRSHYAAADCVLLDSRFVAHLLRVTQGIRVPVCTGSDLIAHLFATVMTPADPLILIGGSAAQANTLIERHGLRRLAHFNPPMGFIHDAEAVEACLRFVESNSPFRFCLLAVGSPQQEFIAQALKARGKARGLALCIGASIDFLTGVERRAPRWMRRAGLEWLFRLVQAPERMAARYLVRGPRVFALLRRARIVLRTQELAIPESDAA